MVYLLLPCLKKVGWCPSSLWAAHQATQPCRTLIWHPTCPSPPDCTGGGGGSSQHGADHLCLASYPHMVASIVQVLGKDTLKFHFVCCWSIPTGQMTRWRYVCWQIWQWTASYISCCQIEFHVSKIVTVVECRVSLGQPTKQVHLYRGQQEPVRAPLPLLPTVLFNHIHRLGQTSANYVMSVFRH